MFLCTTGFRLERSLVRHPYFIYVAVQTCSEMSVECSSCRMMQTDYRALGFLDDLRILTPRLEVISVVLKVLQMSG